MCISMCVLEACSRRTAPNPPASQLHISPHISVPLLTHSLALSLSLDLAQRAQCYVFATGHGRAIIGFSENNASATVCLERCGATVTATATAMLRVRMRSCEHAQQSTGVVYYKNMRRSSSTFAECAERDANRICRQRRTSNENFDGDGDGDGAFWYTVGQIPPSPIASTRRATCRISVAYSDVRPVGS